MTTSNTAPSVMVDGISGCCQRIEPRLFSRLSRSEQPACGPQTQVVHQAVCVCGGGIWMEGYHFNISFTQSHGFRYFISKKEKDFKDLLLKSMWTCEACQTSCMFSRGWFCLLGPLDLPQKQGPLTFLSFAPPPSLSLFDRSSAKQKLPFPAFLFSDTFLYQSVLHDPESWQSTIYFQKTSRKAMANWLWPIALLPPNCASTPDQGRSDAGSRVYMLPSTEGLFPSVGQTLHQERCCRVPTVEASLKTPGRLIKDLNI